MENRVALIEALLFATETPLSLEELGRIINEEADAALSPEDIKRAVGELRDRTVAGRGFYLEEVAGGYQFRTQPEFAPYLRRLQKEKPYRVSRSAMEVLSIVAYRQPLSRIDIDDIRGVDSSSALKTLMERGLLRTVGRSDEVGHPMLYSTTPLFLEVFNLKDLESLPPLAEPAAPQPLEQEGGTGTGEATGEETAPVAPFSEQLIRLAEESDVDSALIDELQHEMLKLSAVETQVLTSAFPDHSHEATSAETDLPNRASVASTGGTVD